MIENSTEPTQPKESSLSTTVFTGEFFKEAFQVDQDINSELLESSATKQHPIFTLQECLLASTKDVLMQMAKEHGLTLPSSLKKVEVASRLKDHIIKFFKE
jgi:hypothetical protein